MKYWIYDWDKLASEVSTPAQKALITSIAFFLCFSVRAIYRHYDNIDMYNISFWKEMLGANFLISLLIGAIVYLFALRNQKKKNANRANSHSSVGKNRHIKK
jgi:hypothetical protein